MAGKSSYGQFCPVALAATILAERWMPLVIRELLCGSARFNDLQRGVPRMSSALLSQRLKQLQFAGIVERLHGAAGIEYHLTPAGRELFPVIREMGFWSQRWLRHDLVNTENLDPDLLMWDIRRNVSGHAVARPGRYVAEFRLSGCLSAGAVTGWCSTARPSTFATAIRASISISMWKPISAR